MPTPATTFGSGMTQSFQQSAPGAPPLPGAKQPASMSSPLTNPVKPVGGVPASGSTANANSFSTPVQSTPAVPAGGTTATPGAVSSAPKQMSFSMKVPQEWANKLRGVAEGVGGIASAGANAYQNFNSGLLGKAKMFMSDPKNFAQTLGALAPIASPLMRTAGMPLMLGAYSFLKDPSYLNALSNGRIPKLGAAIPPAPKSDPFDIGTPSLLGTTKPVASTPMAGALHKPVTPVVGQSYSKPNSAADAYDLATGTGGLTAGLTTRKATGALGKAVSRGIAPAMTALELTGAKEKLSGAPEKSWRDVATEHQQSLNPQQWAQNYADIANSNSSLPAKGLQMTMNSLSNPYLLSRMDPLGNALSAAKGVEDWTGIGNLAHTATGGAIGAPASGKTKSVPAALAQMLYLSGPDTRNQRPVAPLAR